MIRPLRDAALAALVLLLLAPAPAQARFLLLDADFDDLSTGQALQRRGAAFGEPVPGPFDQGEEEVVMDGVGDKSVRIPDAAADPAQPSSLHWALLDERNVSDGRLTVAFELAAESLDNYEVLVNDEFGTLSFLQLRFTPLGELTWSDLNTPGPTVFGTYAPDQVLAFEIVLRLNPGTYDLSLDGVPVVTGEPIGFANPSIARLVVGATADAGGTGALRFDVPRIDWRPGTAYVLLEADFEDEPVDQVIGTGGAALGQPVSFNATVPRVRAGLFPSQALEIPDGSQTSTNSVTFEFLDDAEIDDQPVSITAWLQTDSDTTYFMRLREQGSNTQTILDVSIAADGYVAVRDGDGFTDQVGAVLPGVPFRLELALEMGGRAYSLWVDGERVRHRAPLGGDGSRGVGRVIFAADYDFDFAGRLLIDEIRAHAWNPVVTSVSPGAAPRAAALQGAAPNPFNPRTEIRFSLAAPGRAVLDVVDLRGRLVARLLDADLEAGEHRAVWDGRDAAGGRGPAGTYLARLTVGGAVDTTPLLLVK